MTFVAIDPGPTQSALLWFSPTAGVQDAMIVDNQEALGLLGCQHSVIEMVASYGMPVGKDVFETVYWIGRFAERSLFSDRVFRLDVKMHLCHDSRAKDPNIRQALLDRFPATGGGKNPQIGTKAQPGPLFGIKSHLWAALAVAVYWNDTQID